MRVRHILDRLITLDLLLSIVAALSVVSANNFNMSSIV